MTLPKAVLEPRILPAGDRYILVELGRSGGLELSLRALRVAEIIAGENCGGVTEILPMFASVLVGVDEDRGHRSQIEGLCQRAADAAVAADNLAHLSRLLDIPVLYGDPWTAACVEDHSAKVAPVEYNPAFVARTNGLEGPEQVYAVHCSTDHWVAGVGFWPGLPDMLPLDPTCQLSVPKYDPPRIWTTPGGIGVGGGFTSIYPLRTPGGYYLIGRTPAPIFGLQYAESPGFDGLAVLFRPGDRVRFRPISLEEFEELDAYASAGEYRHTVLSEDLVDLTPYDRLAHGRRESAAEWERR